MTEDLKRYQMLEDEFRRVRARVSSAMMRVLSSLRSPTAVLLEFQDLINHSLCLTYVTATKQDIMIQDMI
jgi:hypothetical protein